MISGKTIFIAPLDWGMGHASRCVPIIQELKAKNRVIIGVTEKNDFFFHAYFPDLALMKISSYPISYSKRLPLWLKLLVQWPSIRSTIKRENKELEKLIREQNIDLVISDNRFGLNSEKVKSIFITHQLHLKAPFFSSFANQLNRFYIQRFNEVWVPDYNEIEKRLSGDLSNSSEIKIPVTYIGPKSALALHPESDERRAQFDYLFLLSGPEPQRTILEEIFFEKTKELSGKAAIVRGSNNQKKYYAPNVLVFDFLTGESLRQLILEANTVICRSGYSTLMDLHLLGKRDLILIPTPGQTEQEYLAEWWKEKFSAQVVSQNDFLKKF